MRTLHQRGELERLLDQVLLEGEGFKIIDLDPSTSDDAPSPKKKPGPKDQTVVFPEGIPDLRTWGRTICTLPKIAAKKKTYDELIDQCKTDDELREYVQWVKDNGTHVSCKVRDFSDYMRASNVSMSKLLERGPSKIYYPGTDEERVLK
eukprot:Skav204000  [mRNA]  locus=scaffold1114:70927:71373:+ [translate_table: standard]